ncbi:Endonuclease III [uncultured archaeon]|nr:Endonuclease III [uncultured archaeon]
MKNHKIILANFRCFSLQHTLDSGQFFRYEKTGDWYHCKERDKTFKIRQKGNNLEFEGADEKYVRKLFGLNCDYYKIIRELSKDKKLIPAIRKYRGLRIMQRDPWETLISFQCSIFSNIKKIKLNMNLLAKEFGEDFAGKLNDLQKIKNCATGFRAKYLYQANKMVDDKYFEKLRKMNYSQAKKELMKLPGVGEKVADCVCLFSLGKMEAFPVDVWMQRMMTKYYKKEKLKDIQKFAQQKWKHPGYAQQFLFHWGRHDYTR